MPCLRGEDKIPSENPLRLFTIGYEKAPLEGFLDTLAANGVQQTVDVRDVAFSRNFRYSKAPLMRELAERGQRYVHLPVLGAPKELRRRLEAQGDLAAFLAEVRDVLAGRQDDLRKALTLVETVPSALLCRERDALQCHRSVVAELLAAMSSGPVEIVHLSVPPKEPARSSRRSSADG
jgi:uncharacterized protein (DUF488 family)